jgi:hypothetical protein
MPTITDVGYVTPAGQDVLPSTGPHLDVRVLKDGKYIDPGTIRSLLTRLKVGKERTPLWQQEGEQWRATFPITSGYGQRTAPTKGASTFHQAHDYGVAGGTQLSWEGPGSFTPGSGYGTIQTTDPQGNPYEIRLLHTKGGKQTNVSGETPSAAMPEAAVEGDRIIYLTGKKKKSDSASDFLNYFIQQELEGKPSAQASTFNPTALLTQAIFQTPNYLT